MTEDAGRLREAALGRWLVVGAAFFWGTSATLARSVFRDLNVPVLTVVELRLLIASVLLGLWLVFRHPAALRVRRADWLYFVILAMLGVATVQASYYYSISVLGVGLAILVQYIAPTLIVLVDIMRGRPVHRITIIAVLAALAGTALLVSNAGASRIAATAWQWMIAFSSAVWFAFYILYSKRGLERYRPETVLFYTFAVAGTFWAFVTSPAKILAAGYDTRTWLLFLVLGVFSTLVPFSLFYAGLKRMKAAEAGIIATTEPVIASVSAALLLHEGLIPLQWLGAALVLVAAVAASREHNSEEAKAHG
ncbi:MAG: EamA family transporter [Candidatus Eisenbacteria bacterium]